MKIKMKTGLSGPEFSLAPGDTKFFDDADEAQRLIEAGFGERVPEEILRVTETPTERVARLQEELRVAQAEADAQTETRPADPPAPSPGKTTGAKPDKAKA